LLFLEIRLSFLSKKEDFMSTPSPIGTLPNPIEQIPVQRTGTGKSITFAPTDPIISKALTKKFGLKSLSERSATTAIESSQTARTEVAGASGQVEASVESPQTAQSSSVAEATGESSQPGETQEFKKLVNELNDGKYKPGFLSRFFIKLKAAFQGKHYKIELATQNFKKIENKKEFLKAAFAFINSPGNEDNRDDNVQTLLLLCTRYYSSLSESEVNTDNAFGIKKTIEDIQSILNENISDKKSIPRDAYDKFQRAAKAALKKLNGNQEGCYEHEVEPEDHEPLLSVDDPNLVDLDIVSKSPIPLGFEKEKAKNGFRTLVNELSSMDSNSGEFEGKLKNFLGLHSFKIFNTKEGIAFIQQCYKNMPNGIKFLEKALDQLGLTEGAKFFKWRKFG
jgi:hypothetical protein